MSPSLVSTGPWTPFPRAWVVHVKCLLQALDAYNPDAVVVKVQSLKCQPCLKGPPWMQQQYCCCSDSKSCCYKCGRCLLRAVCSLKAVLGCYKLYNEMPFQVATTLQSQMQVPVHRMCCSRSMLSSKEMLEMLSLFAHKNGQHSLHRNAVTDARFAAKSQACLLT